MRRNKDMIIIPFRSCRKSTTAAVLGAATDEHHAALVAGSDEEYAGASPAPHIVLKMHLHCASCAAKIERVVMDIPGTFARGLSLSAGELLILCYLSSHGTRSFRPSCRGGQGRDGRGGEPGYGHRDGGRGGGGDERPGQDEEARHGRQGRQERRPRAKRRGGGNAT